MLQICGPWCTRYYPQMSNIALQSLATLCLSMPKRYAKVPDFMFSQNQLVHIFDDIQFILFKNDRLPFARCYFHFLAVLAVNSARI